MEKNWRGKIPSVKDMTFYEKYKVRPFWIKKFGRLSEDNKYLLPRIRAMFCLANYLKKKNKINYDDFKCLY